VLTGAGGGLGRAFAAALGPACDELLLVGRDPTRLARAAVAAGLGARVADEGQRKEIESLLATMR